MIFRNPKNRICIFKVKGYLKRMPFRVLKNLKINNCVPAVSNRHLMKCKYCSSDCIRKGMYKSIQKYRCKGCLKYQRANYTYRAYTVTDIRIVVLVKEGCGIRSIARILHISPTTLLSRIRTIANRLSRKTSLVFGANYQVDELFSYVGVKSNRICIAYSINQETGDVVDIVVGRRNKGNLTKIISTLILAEAKKITTDKLRIYKEIIPNNMHSTKFRGINKIERQNLSLRTHLKRLNRRTICFSRSTTMLLAVVKIYFWG